MTLNSAGTELKGAQIVEGKDATLIMVGAVNGYTGTYTPDISTSTPSTKCTAQFKRSAGTACHVAELTASASAPTATSAGMAATFAIAASAALAAIAL